MRIILSILLSTIAMLPIHSQDRITGKSFATRSEIIASNGMAATSHPLATQIALDILKKGGNAVDAAIAANAALGLMEPTGCGIGGDLFAIIWDSETKKLYGLNASGRSPKTLTLEYFRKNGLEKIPAYGPLPVSVPGCVDGWFELNKKFGSLEMKELLEPAIYYAEHGFPVTELIAHYWQRGVALHGAKYPNVYETFTIDGKNTPGKGDIFKNPYLAETYKRIAENGRDEFYKGQTAKVIVSFMESQGGFLSLDDLASHHSDWIEPVSTNYRGYDVWELPPNGHGIAALQMLNILEAYDFSETYFGSARHIHLFVEAKKLVFEDRAKYYADIDFANVPVDWLISKEYASERRKLINEKRAGVFEAGKEMEGGTIYLTTADKNGNMVSLIQSNFRGLGSGMVPPEMGFMLQNRGELFSLSDGHANIYAPGKRPFHTIIPAFVTKDGEPFLSFGVMGGDFQPLGHVQILMNIIDFGMNLQEAGDAPRISHSGSSDPTGLAGKGVGETELESGFDYEVLRELMQMGHKVVFKNDGFGGYQAIMYDKNRKIYMGASESRKDGQAAGY
ncbi:MAG: gamma-glutamyltransferase [Bacteroidales bacterium]